MRLLGTHELQSDSNQFSLSDQSLGVQSRRSFMTSDLLLANKCDQSLGVQSIMFSMTRNFRLNPSVLANALKMIKLSLLNKSVADVSLFANASNMLAHLVSEP
mmetsp:Transcript_24986/g.41163  ORF Transcript_24986/g.41163 Transcript_24986/m.41163 type:complete len:103 (+) Transcript_24986:706-1014(+)